MAVAKPAMSLVTAIRWVPRGYAATFPTKYNVDDEELARISKLAKLKLEDAKEDFDKAQKGDHNDDDERVNDNGTAASKEDSDKDANGINLPQSKE